MYALLLFHKQHEGNNLWLFESRNMGCFNGLNSNNAFDFPKSGSTNVVLSSGQQDLRGEWTANSRGPAEGLIRQEMDNSEAATLFNQSELVALGWITEGYTQAQPEQIANSGMFSHAIPSIMAYYNTLEHIVGPYNPWSHNQEQTRRDLTPNEHRAKNVLRLLHTIPLSTPNIIIPNEGLTYEQAVRVGHSALRNKLLATLCHSRRYYSNMLFDLVGSERPSGTAVAYLQVFRNVTRSYTTDWSTGNAQLRNAKEQLVKSCLNANAGGTHHKSVVCLLSQVYNHGSDSDILSFASNYILPFSMRFGYFALQGFFGDTRSMVDTGRYVKGSQSANLQANFSTAMHPWMGTIGSESSFREFMNTLLTYTTNVTNFQMYCNIGRANRMVQSLDQFMSSVRQYAEPLFRIDTANLAQDLTRLAGRFPDVRVAPHPESTENRTQGAAAEFTQWQEAVAATIH